MGQLVVRLYRDPSIERVFYGGGELAMSGAAAQTRSWIFISSHALIDEGAEFIVAGEQPKRESME